jgi:hypothetical protein
MIHFSFSDIQEFSVFRTLKNWGLGLLIAATVLFGLNTVEIVSVSQEQVFILLGMSATLFAIANKRSMTSGNFFGVVTLSLLAVVVFSYLTFDRRYDFETEKWVAGFLMVLLVLICALFKLKKKLSPFVVLGNSRNWRYFHIYAGMGFFLIFLFHVNFQLPVGFFSNILFYVVVGFMVFSLSGLLLQKWIPLKLAGLDRDVIFEKVPFIVDQLRERVHTLLYLFKKSGPVSITLTEFCEQEVFPFLKGPFPQVPLFFFKTTAGSWNLLKFDAVVPFLNVQEKQLLEEIRSICLEKNQLDIHYSLQWTLRSWLWLHIIISSLLIILVSYHIIFILIY